MRLLSLTLISSICLSLSVSAHAELVGCSTADGRLIVAMDKCAETTIIPTLQQGRRGFSTKIIPQNLKKIPLEKAPAEILQTIIYPSAVGDLAAYVSPDPQDGKKHPAIIWMTGGDCNSIGDIWSPNPRSNDQTAASYRKAGILMMYPSLRGGNDNPGKREGFYGEVDDVISAAKYLRTLSYIDPNRIYLGGHSTGGTLTLLVAESTDIFRAIFSFGPVFDSVGYGVERGWLPFDVNNKNERMLRAPLYWLPSIKSPTWILEGTDGNIDSLQEMKKASRNPKLHFAEVKRADHFSILAPSNDLIAKKILADTAKVTNISLSEAELNQNFDK